MDDLGSRLQRSLAAGFAIERELGGGGMARVFLAEERALGRRVVVKVLDLEGVVAASAERFRREVQLIAKLQHPHIVPLLTAGGDDTMLWYVMPYVSGESLRARLVREGAIPLADVVRIGRELFDALGFAHDQGVVHRDVKPENILIEGRHVVVADFGVAKALADSGVSTALTTAGLALGTPAYMAPEQAMADPTTNHRADLYAAGVVLFEMLAGAPPFSGSAQSVVAAHIASEPPRLEERRNDLPPALVQLIRRLMAKNPAERPQSAHEAHAILEAVSTPAATAAIVVSPARSRARWLVPVAAVVLAGGVWAAKSLTPASSIADGADVIAVMPLGSTGDSALTHLGRDLVVTLSTSLDGVGALRAVDPMSVLQGAKELPQPLGLADAIALAKRLGARTVVHGTATAEAGRARLELSLYPVAGGDFIAKATTLGPPDSIRSLTDSLTRQLLEQIWRRGKAPSPLLSEVATSSGPALRAFLSGEAFFERLQMDSAIPAYTQAVALDSMFAQAWLRLDYSRSLVLLPVDTAIRRHLRSMRDRLPPREREWLDLRFAALPFLPGLDSARVIAARYPESYAMQYSVMDRIVHTGPRYGIAISEALPYLERLKVLSPRNPDIDFHRFMVAMGMADTAAAIDALKRRIGSGGVFTSDAVGLRTLEAAVAGRPLPLREYARSIDSGADRNLKLNPDFGWYSGFQSNIPFGGREAGDSLAAALSATHFGAANPQFISYNRATRAIARGSVNDGLSGLAAFAGTRAPTAVRSSAAWAAADAAWFGLISPGEAAAILTQVKPSLANSRTASERLDVQWADGIIAIAAGDSARLEAAVRGISDTSRVARTISRELHALWRERHTGDIDSLRAFDDDASRTGVSMLPGMPIRRAALGRALVKAGDAVGAERLLQWPDASSNSIRIDLVSFIFGSYTSYERGLAAEARGDRKAAIRHYNDFVVMIDRPPPSMATSIAAAKAKLARLTDASR